MRQDPAEALLAFCHLTVFLLTNPAPVQADVVVLKNSDSLLSRHYKRGFLTGWNECLRMKFHEGEFATANFEAVGSACDQRQRRICIGLFLSIHFQAALNNQSTSFTLARN